VGARRKVLGLFKQWAPELKRKDQRLGIVSVAASLDILYDIGGEARIFPYVHWCAPESNVSASAESLSELAELAGRVEVEQRIRESSQRHIPTDEPPLPGYYVDVRGRIIKRTFECRCFEIRIRPDGTEVVVRELPAA
jgi:hypothetical protein